MSTPEPVADKARRNSSRGVFGITLVELLIFIVIVSVGLAGVLTVYNTVVRRSADPLIAKQMTAIAEALLEEVQLMPFTLCDPDDAHAATATTNTVNPADPTQCASLPEAMGPEAGEARGHAVTPFDNVNVRKAIAAAIDVQGLIDTVLLGRGTALPLSFRHPQIPGAINIPHTFDPEQAKTLLEEAGLKRLSAPLPRTIDEIESFLSSRPAPASAPAMAQLTRRRCAAGTPRMPAASSSAGAGSAASGGRC